MSERKISFNKSTFVKHKFTFLFFILLTLSFLFNFSTAHDLITKRYLPMFLFVLFLVGFNRKEDFNIIGLIRFFRSIFISSLIVFFFSDYLSITRDLMESDLIFSVASDSNSFSLSYFSFTRNMGPTWDHRILAILAYLYLLLTVIHRPKYWKWDIALSLVIVVTTLSRGAILTYTFILVAHFILIGKRKLVIAFALIAFSSLLIVLTLVLFSGDLFSDSTLDYLRSFNPKSANNALDQRAVFADYSMTAFADGPIWGRGVGYLTSRLIERSIIVDGVSISAAGDAFWYILLAEMGIVGFLLYLLFLKEVFLSKSILSLALFLGFSIQLLGTDIPDMRFYYFAILVIVFMSKRALSVNTTNSVN